MNLLKSLNYRDLISLLAGGLLAFAFAPFNIYPLAVICPAILLIVWRDCSLKQAFWRGFIFGIGFFGIAASWIFVSIHEFGNTSAPLAVFITSLFVFFLSLYPAVQGYVLTRFFPCDNFSKFCLAFPSSWVLLEWIRGWFLSGFPWLFLGASQVASPLSGLAPVIGEYGISFVVVFCSGLLVYGFYALFTPKKWRAALCFLAIILIWVGAALLTSINWTKPQGQPIKVSLVQGNIPQQLKWDPAYLQATLQSYYQLTETHWDSQIIVWPEAAIPMLLNDAKNFLDPLDQEAKQHHTAFITGIPIQDGFDYYNGIISLGIGHGIYYKRHLVPFGEYVPLDSLLRGLIGIFNIPMSNFSAGPFQQNNLRTDDTIIAPFVCYEIAYPKLVLSLLPQANLLLTVSNDAWFGDSFAPAQHLQIGQMRALETGRYHLFSSNTGLTAIITPQGKIQASAPPFQKAVLTGTVQKLVGATPYVWMGYIPILVLMGLLFLIAVPLTKRCKLTNELVQCG